MARVDRSSFCVNADSHNILFHVKVEPTITLYDINLTVWIESLLFHVPSTLPKHTIITYQYIFIFCRTFLFLCYWCVTLVLINLLKMNWYMLHFVILPFLIKAKSYFIIFSSDSIRFCLMLCKTISIFLYRNIFYIEVLSWSWQSWYMHEQNQQGQFVSGT